MVEILGWIGSALIVLSLIQRDVRRLRQVNLVAAVVLIVFNAALGIGSMVALNVILVVVNGYHLLRKRPPEAQPSFRQEVVDVG